MAVHLGVFAGSAKIETPRGLYTPGHDIRPEGYEKYAPLKDPYFIVRDTSGGKGVMAVPNRSDPKEADRCFADELMVEIAAKFPKKRSAAPAPGPKAK